MKKFIVNATDVEWLLTNGLNKNMSLAQIEELMENCLEEESSLDGESSYDEDKE